MQPLRRISHLRPQHGHNLIVLPTVRTAPTHPHKHKHIHMASTRPSSSPIPSSTPLPPSWNSCMHGTPHSACAPRPPHRVRHTPPTTPLRIAYLSLPLRFLGCGTSTASVDTAGRQAGTLNPHHSITPQRTVEPDTADRQHPEPSIYLPQCMLTAVCIPTAVCINTVKALPVQNIAPQHRRRRALTGRCISAHASAHGGRVGYGGRG